MRTQGKNRVQGNESREDGDAPNLKFNVWR